MGQYEPDDSRNVTLRPGHEPGDIERTGPHEDAARKDAQRREAEEEREKAEAEKLRRRDEA